MTRDEAINILGKYDLGFCEVEGDPIPAQDLADAFDMAIEALKAPTENTNTPTDTSTDLISRQDAIALVIKAIHGTDNKEIQEYLFDGLRKQMWSLPSADRPPGKWVHGEGDSRWMCSVCKCKENVPTIMGNPTVWDYCPNCGARMLGEDSDTE